MNKFFLAALLSTTANVMASPAVAQDTMADDAAISGDDIIVTARREAEGLQDVPVSVQVVTGNKLQELAITSAEEISKVAPGLTLTNEADSTRVVLRGVTWQPGSGTASTPIYLNEIAFDPRDSIKAIYDIGQVEVLRGPQGTSRGAPSISGAVTLTTRRPVLGEFGGYVQGLYGSGDHWDLQGAVNVPVIGDILAIRLAANIEESDGDRIFSVNSDIQPKLKDRNYRATVLFEPTDTVSLLAMYQNRSTDANVYRQVVGTGSPGFAALGIPANFNGPALTLKDRAAVEGAPYRYRERQELLTVNAKWEVLGHVLTYNFGKKWDDSKPQVLSFDTLNILPGYEPFNSTIYNASSFRTHEIRISSQPDPDRPFDYDIGWFSRHGSSNIDFANPVFLPGAFGAPLQSIPGQVTEPLDQYILTALTNIDLGSVFDSFYGNVRFQLGENTELSGGLAIVRDRVPLALTITTSSAQIAFPRFLPAAAGGCPSPLLPDSPVYGAGYCEVSQPASALPVELYNNKYSDAIYNFSLSHKISDSLLVYATTGSSFRSGLPAINNTGLPNDLLAPDPETAKSYEIGVKTNWGRKLRVNAAIFQLDYSGQLVTFEGVNYFNAVTSQPAQTSISFYRNIDSRVRGFELDIAAQPLDNLSLGAFFSYAKIKSRGSTVPCNDASGPPITAANPINFCNSPKGETLNTQAPFQATVNGSYELPLSDWLNGYLRFNVNYQGKNPNFGNFRQADGSFKPVEDYAIVDLFAGVTGNDGAWDLGVYAKNVFDKQVELSRVDVSNTVFPLFSAPDGYDTVRISRPREIGVTMRYSFGSR